MEACSTMSYNSSTKKARIHQKIKMHIYKYLIVFFNTYPGLFRRIDCRKEWWQFQILIEIIKYFTTYFDYLRMSHCFWRESGRIFCTFISEGRMFPMLKRLDPTTHKGEDHMISSNSFVFEIGNGAKNALDLFATGSCTWPVCLDLGALVTLSGSGDSSSRHETRNFSTRFLYPLDHKLSTRPGFRDEALVHIRQRRRV